MKNIVIIGASRGIGKELGLQLATDNKVLLLSRNLESLKSIQIQGGENISIAPFDLNTGQVKNAILNIIAAHFETVDVLINNAGYLINKPILETSREEMEEVFKVNVFGLIEACQAVVPFMSSGGHIVNIGSMGGVQGSSKFPGLSIYSASKAAVAGFSECLAEELKDENIKVNCLALGAAQTEMLAEAFPGYEAPVSAAKMAEFIADFSLNSHEWLNGKVIPVSLSTP